MKLYYSPGACSLSPNIILHEIGAEFVLERVDLATKTLEDGRDFRSITAKGQVPALELDDGSVLTEGVAIVLHLADSVPAAGLIPPAGSIARARVQEMLNFIATELHKAFGLLFNPASSADARAAATALVSSKLDLLEGQLADGRHWLCGSQFTPADSYGFAVTRWTAFQGIDLNRWPAIVDWMDRVGSRPAVKDAMAREA